jgi:hypothetical protein
MGKSGGRFPKYKVLIASGRSLTLLDNPKILEFPEECKPFVVVLEERRKEEGFAWDVGRVDTLLMLASRGPSKEMKESGGVVGRSMAPSLNPPKKEVEEK